MLLHLDLAFEQNPLGKKHIYFDGCSIPISSTRIV